MSKKIIPVIDKRRLVKSSHGGLWQAHRLEGVTKNSGIKPVRKKKKEGG